MWKWAAVCLGLFFVCGTMGCATKSHVKKSAGRGAVSGAVGGAVGGLVRGAFRGDPLERAVEGAAVGAASGATVGALHGAAKNKELKQEFGDTNFDGLMALVNRDYPAAKKWASQTANDPNPAYRRASAMLSALIAQETLSEEERVPYLEKLIEVDDALNTMPEAIAEVRDAEKNLKELRKELGAL